MPRHQPSRLLALAAVAAASAHGALAQSRRLLAPDDMNGARRSILLAQNCSDAATPCQHWGTCDVISGRCQCPPGYGGTLCSDLLYPACRHTVKPGPNGEPPAMSCTFVGPQSCECYRQCDQRPEFPDHRSSSYCFSRGALPAEEQLSTLPAEDEEGVAYYKNWMIFQGKKEPEEKVTRKEYMANIRDPYLPPSKCPNECWGNGFCRQLSWEAEPSCVCHRGFTGKGCEKVDVNACINLCSGRGKCLRGFCSCDFGWFGIDCGYNLFTNLTSARQAFTAEVEVPEGDTPVAVDWSLASRPLAREPDATKLRIYVHELPPWMNLLVWGEELKEYTSRLEGGYGGWRSFLERLLTDWEVRTLDPNEANLFYVPAFTVPYTHNSNNVGHYVARVVDFLKLEHPKIWGRNQGRDHIFMALGDLGMCPLDMFPEHHNFIWMTHFGLTFYRNVDPNYRTRDSNRCFDPLGMVVLCPNLGNMRVRAAHTWPELYPEDFEGKVPPTPPERTELFFFAGSTGETASRTAEYSMGVRQRIVRIFKQRNESGFTVARSVPHADERMRRSVFCLAPSGFGWGSRIVETIVSGCIPVVVQDSVYQPGHDVLPYDDFSVRIRFEDLDNIPEILRSISQEEIRELQVNVKKWHKHFLWHEEGGFSFEVALESLRRKLHNLQVQRAPWPPPPPPRAREPWPL